MCISVSSCTDDLFGYEEKECVVGRPVYATFDFGNGSFEDVSITTRATFDGGFEHLIKNFYVMVFKDNESGTGDKVYGKFFDINNKRFVDKFNDKENLEKEVWCVTPSTFKNKNGITEINNGYKVPFEPTHGSVRLKIPSGGPFHVYVIANIQASYLELSPELFDGIKNESDLKKVVVKLKGNATYRTEMMMIGDADKVYVNKDTKKVTAGDSSTEIKYTNSTNNSLKLKRFDAKVEVRIHVDPTKAVGEKDNKIKEFIPETWQVMNLTNCANLVDNQNPIDDKDEYFYNTTPNNFEEERTIEVGGENKAEHVFSFYMLENKQNAKEEIVIDKTKYENENEAKALAKKEAYHKRDMRIKDEKGKYDTSTKNKWKYAPEHGTYLVIKGQVVMDYNKETTEAQTLHADVVYYIHLGNFNDPVKGVNNYDVLRNTRYTYTITIVDVNKIIVEVETSIDNDPSKVQEEQSGAAGDVFIAKHKICVMDAHYGQDVLCFYAEDINDNLSWYVKTPFNPEGADSKDVDASLLDFRWVKFARNLLKNKSDNSLITKEHAVNPSEEAEYIKNQKYSRMNRWYFGDDYLEYNKNTPTYKKLMYVNALVEYLQEQKHLLDDKKPNDFREETIEYKNSQGNIVSRTVKAIYVTAFVDEYYYETVPVAGSAVKNLWTMFVNDCGNRMMHILCDSKRSLDGESTYTNSVFTIRQTPIQTIYNNDMSVAPEHAWGCESVDENGVYDEGNGLDYGTKVKNAKGEYILQLPRHNDDNLYTSNKDIVDKGMNGLFNTWKMSAFYIKSHNVSGIQDPKWNTYLNITENNSLDNTLYWELPESYDPQNPNYTPKDKEGIKPLKDNIHFIKGKHWLYSYLIRNRDKNGDGIIQSEEIKWYIASLDQLQLLFIGSEGISGEAQIYPDKIAAQTGKINEGRDERYRLHIISSTINIDKLPSILWAEEAVSVSESNEYDTPGLLGVRCVRNLGIDDWNAKTTEKPTLYDPVIICKEDIAKKRITFDMSRMNRRSLRGGGVTDPNLPSMQTTDEYGIYSFLPLGLEVYCDVKHNDNTGKDFLQTKRFTWKGRSGSTYTHLKYVLDNGIELEFPERTVGYLPGRWRMPNIREMTLLYIYTDALVPPGTEVNYNYVSPSTYYSLGKFGNSANPKPGADTRWTWYFNKKQVTMWSVINSQAINFILVRDWHPAIRL